MPFKFNPFTGNFDIVGSSEDGGTSGVGKILGQEKPGAVNTKIYQLPADTAAFAQSLMVCNTTGSAQTFRVFLAEDGATFDQSTALFYDAIIEINEAKLIEMVIPFSVEGAALAVWASTADVNFTLLGAEIT